MMHEDELKKKETAETEKELADQDLEKVSGGRSPYGGIMCSRCGGIRDNPSIPDEMRCHCDEEIYYPAF